jgi:hypothetical protein
MKKWIVVLVVALFPALAQGADGVDNGILGLEFGQTVAQVKGAGVGLAPTGESRFGAAQFRAENVPSPVSGFPDVLLMFFDDKLVKVLLVGDTVTDDAYGATLKARFDALRSTLKKKYTETKEMTRAGLKLYDQSSEFMSCLNYSGCGMWAVVFEGGGRDMVLEIRSTGRTSGYLLLTVEGPGFAAVVDEIRRRSEKDVEDAL